ncbi:hypothetical protein CB1_000966005 [Camelus ferus]|nr:hypothetical protein CB1_000966005 [Camelus ferus]
MLTYLTSDFERKELIVMERKREREQLPKRQDESKGPEEMGEDGIQGSSSSHGRGAQGLDRHICFLQILCYLRGCLETQWAYFKVSYGRSRALLQKCLETICQLSIPCGGGDQDSELYSERMLRMEETVRNLLQSQGPPEQKKEETVNIMVYQGKLSEEERKHKEALEGLHMVVDEDSRSEGSSADEGKEKTKLLLERLKALET